jgi:DNA polymerase III sliding clamp (beta) subunit (PCNA family)
MLVNREKLLAAFEAVSPGLAARELIEQSSCLVFLDGKVATFNDEIACSIESPVAGITGAVVAKPLIELLSKLPEEDLDITVEDGKFRVKGKGRRAEVVMDAEVSLPVGSVETPTTWVKLESDFLEGLSIVQAVAATGKDANFTLTCVHLHPDWLEACDNFQAARYPVKTGISKSCLIRQSAIKNVPSLGMTEMAEGDSWLHFRNAAGLVLSCRRWQEAYENLDAIFQCEGETATLPGGLAEAVDKAKIFSSENTENDQVFVKMKDGKLLIRGEGASGKFEEQKSVKFAGDISFLISPKLLVEITKRTNECVVGQGRLKIDTGRFLYVSCLGAVE